MKRCQEIGTQHKVGTMKGAQDNSCSTSNFAHNLVRVEGDGTFCSASEDVIEFENLLVEPQHENDFEDHATCLISEVTEKCLTIEDFPCSDNHYKPNTDFCILNNGCTGDGKLEPKLEYLADVPQGADEVGNLHLTGNLSGGCPDYLLDTYAGIAEKNSLLDYPPQYGPCLDNFGFECFPESAMMEGGAPDISDMSNAIIPLPDSISDQGTALFLDSMSISELHEAFRSTFGRDTYVNDKQWLRHRIFFGLQHLIELGNSSSLIESRLSSNEGEDNMIFLPSNEPSERACGSFTDIHGSKKVVGKAAGGRHKRKDVPTASFSETSISGSGSAKSGDRESALTTRKRMRKPTRRYIEELSDMKSRCCNERLEAHVASSRAKILRVKTNSQHHRKGSGDFPLVLAEETLARSDSQIPCTLQVRRGRPRKNFNLGKSNDSPVINHQTFVQEDDSKGNKGHRNFVSGLPEYEPQYGLSNNCTPTSRDEKSEIRRKHHRLWTLPEVLKLIDGVSHYGVGRWTEIKRLLFSSSAYRTSVDLKDKWRNLLRSSGAEMHYKKEVEPRKKHKSLPMPQSVIRQVRELAVIYPYPRERKARVPLLADDTSPSSVGIKDGGGGGITRSGRTVHRQSSCT